MRVVVEERAPALPLPVSPSPEVQRAEAVAGGQAEDRFFFYRVRTGILVGIVVWTLVTCGVLAVALLLTDRFALGSLPAGLLGGGLGGAFLGGLVAVPELIGNRA